MLWNPEFRKNVQLELNPVKLVLMPVVLGMIFAIVYLSVDKHEPAAPQMQTASLVLFALLVFVWGTKMAIESLVSEFNDRTWDSQRMTAISPWTLAWGKLFGSTLFAWYGGLFCLLLFAACSFAFPATESLRPGKVLLILSFAGLCTQTTLLAFILTEFAKNREAAKMNLSSYSIVAVLFFAQAASFAGGAYHARNTIRWYGFGLHPLDMVLYSSLFFCIWGIIGFYRAMRKELQFENSPAVWTLFVLSLMAYCAGFIPPDSQPALLLARLWVSLVIAITSFYLMLLAEPKHLVDFKLIQEKLRLKHWTGLAQKIPAWFISLLLAAILCAVLMLMPGTANLASGHTEYAFLRSSPLALLLFCLRDLGIVLHVNLNSNKKNRDMTALFYLSICYLLIPLLLNIAGAKSILAWFVPFNQASFFNAVVPIAVQAVLALHLAGKKLR